MVLRVADIAQLASLKDDAPSANEIVTSWKGIGRYIESCLNQGKGVRLPKLGVFTFQVDKFHLGNNGTLGERIPLFILDRSFTGSHGLNLKTHLQITPNVLPTPLNFAAAAYYTELPRDIVERSYNYFILTLGEAVRQKKSLSIDFDVSTLYVNGGSNYGEMVFKTRKKVIGEEVVPHDQQVPNFQTERKTDHPITQLRREYFDGQEDAPPFEEFPVSQTQLQLQRSLRPQLAHHRDTNRIGMTRNLELFVGCVRCGAVFTWGIVGIYCICLCMGYYWDIFVYVYVWVMWIYMYAHMYFVVLGRASNDYFVVFNLIFFSFLIFDEFMKTNELN
jgi:hypothetical protein